MDIGYVAFVRVEMNLESKTLADTNDDVLEGDSRRATHRSLTLSPFLRPKYAASSGFIWI
jgi:hypothetical protein